MNRIEIVPSANGTEKPGKRKPLVLPKPRRRPTKAGLSARKTSALVLASIGVGLLALSVYHCTEAISLLTGSHWMLAGLLAVGVDAGMIGSELAALTAHGTKRKKQIEQWASGYIVATVGLSMLLNCYAFGLHSAEGMAWASYILGAFIPTAVFTLGRVAGMQWLSE